MGGRYIPDNAAFKPQDTIDVERSSFQFTMLRGSLNSTRCSEK